MSGARPEADRAPDGILLLDKPAGPSSNQALQHAKRLFGARKAGHAGTLDPLATGLLPILFGEATKFAAYLSNAFKVYEATLLLGTRTTTGDLAGEIIEQRPACVTPQALESVAARFRGAISQIPPMHSALKLGGRPLYELARRGQVVERAARQVHIDELVVCALRSCEVDIRVRCSKGTYIRVLAEDIGAALGCGASLKSLRRTGVGPFEISAAFSFDEVQAASAVERLRMPCPIDAGLTHIPKLTLDADEAKRLSQGQTLALAPARATDGTVRLYEAAGGRFIGLGVCAAGVVRPLRLVVAS